MFWADGMKIGAMVMVLDGRRRAVVPLRSVAVAPAPQPGPHPNRLLTLLGRGTCTNPWRWHDAEMMGCDVLMIWRDGRLPDELWGSNNGDSLCSTRFPKTPP